MILGANSKSPFTGLLFWRRAFTLAIGLFALSACGPEEATWRAYTGSAQGTTYRISVVSEGQNEPELSLLVEEIFAAIDSSMSTYIPTSLISRINSGDTAAVLDPHFIRVFDAAWELSAQCEGLFDCTVGALVNAYGFGPRGRILEVDSASLKRILARTGYNLVRRVDEKLIMDRDSISLDFNALAQGYTVDVIADSLMARGFEHFLVEVGGELLAHGNNSRGEPWKIGIDRPNETINDQDRFVALAQLENCAMATSGNYRKFWENPDTGEKCVHSINPKTGKAESSNLLSCTIVAPNAMRADGCATACMIMGYKRARQWIALQPDLEAMLVYADDRGDVKIYQTEKFPSLN